jgi:hypothetical protein
MMTVAEHPPQDLVQPVHLALENADTARPGDSLGRVPERVGHIADVASVFQRGDEQDARVAFGAELPLDL